MSSSFLGVFLTDEALLELVRELVREVVRELASGTSSSFLCVFLDDEDEALCRCCCSCNLVVLPTEETTLEPYGLFKSFNSLISLSTISLSDMRSRVVFFMVMKRRKTQAVARRVFRIRKHDVSFISRHKRLGTPVYV